MKSSIAIIIRWVFFGTSIIHGPAKGQVDHRIDQCPFELLVTFLLIQAERPARRGGRGGRRFGLLKRGRCFSETMHHFLGWWVVAAASQAERPGRRGRGHHFLGWWVVAAASRRGTARPPRAPAPPQAPHRGDRETATRPPHREHPTAAPAEPRRPRRARSTANTHPPTSTNHAPTNNHQPTTHHPPPTTARAPHNPPATASTPPRRPRPANRL